MGILEILFIGLLIIVTIGLIAAIAYIFKIVNKDK